MSILDFVKTVDDGLTDKSVLIDTRGIMNSNFPSEKLGKVLEIEGYPVFVELIINNTIPKIKGTTLAFFWKEPSRRGPDDWDMTVDLDEQTICLSCYDENAVLTSWRFEKEMGGNFSCEREIAACTPGFVGTENEVYDATEITATLPTLGYIFERAKTILSRK